MINPTYNPQGKETFRVVRMMLAPLVTHVINTPPMEIHMGDDIMYFFTMDSEQLLRGGQFDKLYINEAGLIARLGPIWAEVFLPMLADRSGSAWIQGTPKGKNDFFHFHLRGQDDVNEDGTKNDWRAFQYPTHSNPFIKREELDMLKREMSEDIYRQEVLAEFLDTGGVVFKGLAAMMERSKHTTRLLPQADHCRIGLDLGRHNDFTVLVALSPDNRVIGFDRFNQIDWVVQKQRIRAFCMRYRGKIIMDSTGLGDPIYADLVNQGLAVKPVKFSNDRKKQMVQNLQLLIEDGVLFVPPDGLSMSDPAHDLGPLWKELSAYTFDVTPSGNVRYGAPAGMHDDAVTALFLACSELPPLESYTSLYPNLPDTGREVGEAWSQSGEAGLWLPHSERRAAGLPGLDDLTSLAGSDNGIT